MACCWHGHGPWCHGDGWAARYPYEWAPDERVHRRRRAGREERLRDLEERQAELQEELADIAESIRRIREE